jgi:membrane protein required for colicin V production
MNFVDIIIVLPLIWWTYRGFTKGFVIELASVGALLLGIFIANQFSHFMADILKENFDWNPEYVHLVAFTITFLAVVVAVHFVARMVDKLVKAVALSIPNRIAGAAFGFFKVAFILSVALVVLNQIDKEGKYLSEENKKGSLLYQPTYSFSLKFFPSLESDVRKVKQVNDARESISKEKEETKTEE